MTGEVITGPEIITRAGSTPPRPRTCSTRPPTAVADGVEAAFADGDPRHRDAPAPRPPGRRPLRQRAHPPPADDRPRRDGGLSRLLVASLARSPPCVAVGAARRGCRRTPTTTAVTARHFRLDLRAGGGGGGRGGTGRSGSSTPRSTPSTRGPPVRRHRRRHTSCHVYRDGTGLEPPPAQPARARRSPPPACRSTPVPGRPSDVLTRLPGRAGRRGPACSDRPTAWSGTCRRDRRRGSLTGSCSTRPHGAAAPGRRLAVVHAPSSASTLLVTGTVRAWRRSRRRGRPRLGPPQPRSPPGGPTASAPRRGGRSRGGPRRRPRRRRPSCSRSASTAATPAPRPGPARGWPAALAGLGRYVLPVALRRPSASPCIRNRRSEHRSRRRRARPRVVAVSGSLHVRRGRTRPPAPTTSSDAGGWLGAAVGAPVRGRSPAPGGRRAARASAWPASRWSADVVAATLPHGRPRRPPRGRGVAASAGRPSAPRAGSTTCPPLASERDGAPTARTTAGRRRRRRPGPSADVADDAAPEPDRGASGTRAPEPCRRPTPAGPRPEQLAIELGPGAGPGHVEAAAAEPARRAPGAEVDRRRVEEARPHARAGARRPRRRDPPGRHDRRPDRHPLRARARARA